MLTNDEKDVVIGILRRYRYKNATIEMDTHIQMFTEFAFLLNCTWSPDRDKAIEILYDELLRSFSGVKRCSFKEFFNYFWRK